MAKDGAGVWTVTIPPAVPGFHYYWFNVDGFTCNDPATQSFFGYNKECSGIEIPDAEGDFYAVRDVPHGEVRARVYFSRVTGEWRRALVYTPPGYDTHPEQRYPVLYLQHCAGESERGWTNQGRAQFILDNLLAAGQIRPMLVVMENGMVAQRVGAPAPTVGGRPNEAFAEVVLQDLIPMVDATYRTRPDRKHRAIAGLSMGAGQALQIGLANRDRFGAIASFSGVVPEGFDPATSYGGVFRDPQAFARQETLLWMGAGTAEPPRIYGMKQVAEKIRGAGIPVVWLDVPGLTHEWQTWRRCLLDFAPRLFR